MFSFYSGGEGRGTYALFLRTCKRLFIMLRREKGWRLNIFPQYHANLTQPISHRESQLFAMFVPVTNEVVCAWLKDFRTFLRVSIDAV